MQSHITPPNKEKLPNEENKFLIFSLSPSTKCTCIAQEPIFIYVCKEREREREGIERGRGGQTKLNVYRLLQLSPRFQLPRRLQNCPIYSTELY